MKWPLLILAMAFEASSASAQEKLQATYLGVLFAENVGALKLSHPLGLAADPDGNLYLADTGNHRVVKCNRAGRLLREVGGFGFDDQQFDRPVDVWAGNGLDVLVADYNNQRLSRFDKDLNFISSYYYDRELETSLRFGYPAAVAMSPPGELFVADHEFNRVLRFDVFGKPVASFGDFNWGEGELERPAKIFISRRGEIFVSDSLRHAVMIYDAFGNFKARFGENVLAKPSGMAEWRDGFLVSDRNRNRVIFLSRDGEMRGEFGQFGEDVEELREPAAVVLLNEKTGNTPVVNEASVLAYVLDTGSNRVQVFKLSWDESQ